MTQKPAGEAVKSAVRTLDVLETVVSFGRPMSANELAAVLAIPASSLSYLLTTLVNLGYLDRIGRTYAPGPSFARLAPAGQAARLKDSVRPLVNGMCEQLDETTSFFVPHGNQIESLVSAVSGQALRYAIEEGQIVPLHAMSAGKALLATFEKDRLTQYFAEVERPRFTPRTVCDEAALRAELATISATGLAHTFEEYSLGIAAVGKAVLRKGVAIGAFAIAIPVARYTPELQARAIAALTQAADVLTSQP